MPFSELEPGEANARVGEFRIVDVREPHEFDGPLGRIDGAELIPLAAITEHANALNGSRPLLLVCRSGGRSGKACELLQQHGTAEVTNLVGGMIAWNRADLPIQRTELESLDALLESLAAWLGQVTGRPVEDALSDIDRWLQEAHASRGAPTVQAMSRALETLGANLEAAGAPADLDLISAAFRRDLAVL